MTTSVIKSFEVDSVIYHHPRYYSVPSVGYVRYLIDLVNDADCDFIHEEVESCAGRYGEGIDLSDERFWSNDTDELPDLNLYDYIDHVEMTQE